jgi:hypothetical protein
MRASRTIRNVLGVCALVLGLASIPTAAQAQIPVLCSETALVNAINSANTAGGDTLALTPFCTYTLTSAHGTGPAGPVGLPRITTPINIIGLANTITRAQSAPPFRVLEIDGQANVPETHGQLSLTGVTVRGGDAPGALGGGVINLGGTLAMITSSLQGNSAARGGGLYSDNGSVSLTASTITGNTATGIAGGGGGIWNNSGGVILFAGSVTGNSPDNCSPLGSVPGCTG